METTIERLAQATGLDGTTIENLLNAGWVYQNDQGFRRFLAPEFRAEIRAQE